MRGKSIGAIGLSREYAMLPITMLVSAVLIIAFVLIPFAPVRAEGAEWKITIVDDQGDVGKYSSIAVDSGGSLHISYFDESNSELRYASNSTGEWVRITVDNETAVGTWTSIAVDSEGNPHISYANASLGELRYATYQEGEWDIRIVDSSSLVGMYSSIGLDSAGNAHISYYDASNRDLKYATNANGGWERFTVDGEGDTGEYTSIGLDSSDKVHISYHDSTNSSLRYATNANGGWERFTVDDSEGTGTFTSIALDSSDSAHISYFDETQMALSYANNAQVNWTHTIIDDDGQVGRFTSIVLDPQDGVHISYQDAQSLSLKHATNAGGMWTVRVIDSSSEVGFWTSIAISPNEDLFVSYYDQLNEDLLLATLHEAPPTPPRNLVAEPGNGYVSLAWLPPEDTGGFAELNYVVYRGTNPEQLVDMGGIGNQTQFNDNTVENGVTYYYAIKALNAEGSSDYSNIASATPYGTPSEPLNFRAQIVDDRIILGWAEPTDDGGKPIQGYRIYRGNSSEQLSLLTTVENEMEYTDGNVTEGNTYYYRVSAVNEIGEGHYSPLVQVKFGVEEAEMDLTLILGIAAVVVVAAVAAVLLLKRYR